MQGRDEGGPRLPNLDSSGILTGFQPLVKHLCACTFPPSPLPPLFIACCWCYMQVDSTSWAYHHPIDSSHPSSLPSNLPTSGIDLVWLWSVTHSLLDHRFCVMLIGLAKPKKVYGTVKLSCLWGGDCEAKCLRSFSQIKSLHFFPFYSQTFRTICRCNRGNWF